MPLDLFTLKSTVTVDTRDGERKLKGVDLQARKTADGLNQAEKGAKNLQGGFDGAGRASDKFGGSLASTLRQVSGASTALDALDRSIERLSGSSRTFDALERSTEKYAHAARSSLALALVEGKKNIGGLVIEARAAQKDFERLQKAEEKAMRLSSSRGVVSRALSSVGGGSMLPMLSDVSNIIQSVPQVGAMISSLISPLRNATEEGVRFNAFLETSRLGFTTLLKSEEAANKHLDELQSFAAKTPFQFEDLVSASQRMQAFGFAARDVIPTLTAVGDALSSTGKIGEEDLDGVLRQLGQMRSVGRVTAEDMNAITDHGIPAWDLLATAIGKTVAETRKLAEVGRLDGAQAVKAMDAMMEARYGGQMNAVSNTLTGRLSNLEDTRQQAQGLATKALSGDISAALGAALERGDLAQTMTDGLNKAIAPVSGLVKAAFVGTIGGGVTSGLQEGLEAGFGLIKSQMPDLVFGSVVKTAMDTLGIHSPSKVFIEIGDFTAQGFVEGFEQGMRGRGGGLTDSIDKYIREAAEKYKVDENLIKAVIQRESGGRRTAVSSAGAQGLMQLMPGTAARYGIKDSFDAHENILGGTHYLADLLERFHGDERLALAGYNAGEGRGVMKSPEARLNRLIDKNIDGVGDYVNTILATRDRLNKSFDELDAAVRDLAASTDWRTRGDRSPDEGRGRFADLDPAGQLEVIRGLTGFNPRNYGGGADLTGGMGRFMDSDAFPVLPSVAVDKYLQASTAVSKLTAGLKSASEAQFDLLATLGKTGDAIEESYQRGTAAAGSFYDLVVKKSGKADEAFGNYLDGLADGITGALRDGFENGFSAARADFKHLLLDMTADALNSELRGALRSIFDVKADEASGGQSGSGAAFNPITSLLDRVFHHDATSGQSSHRDTTPAAVRDAGVQAVAAVTQAGAAQGKAIEVTGDATTRGLSGVSSTLLHGLTGIANQIAVGQQATSFWKGLGIAALSGFLNGLTGGLTNGILGGGIGGGSHGGIEIGTGGKSTGHWTGGYITGPGSGTSDSILARLSNGEYVLRKYAVDGIGPRVLDYMNATGRIPDKAIRRAGGGLASRDYTPSTFAVPSARTFTPPINTTESARRSGDVHLNIHQTFNGKTDAKEVGRVMSSAQMKAQLLDAMEEARRNR